MKIVVVGSSGCLAGFLLQSMLNDPTIEKVVRIGRKEDADFYLDLQQPEAFSYECLDEIDLVIFTAAVSGPDQCANQFEYCWQINVDGTRHFIDRAIKKGCRVLFFSSDSVYGDIPGTIYTEDSDTEAQTAYGKMKKAIEDEFFQMPFFKAIRLSYVVSQKDRFVNYCLDCVKDGAIANIFHPFYRNCIVASDVVEAVMWFVKHFDEYKPHVLNLAGKELVSRARIADELNRIMGERLKYAIIRPEEEFFKNRPPITQMQSIYLTQYGILKEESFTQKLQKELKELKI